MNSEITIDKWIQISPSDLTPTIRDDIQGHISKQMVGTCSDIHGHVVSVGDVVAIIENKIENSTSVVSVLVKLNLTVYRPCMGGVDECVIDFIYTEGILGTLNNCQKVLIPFSAFTETHSFSNDTLVPNDDMGGVIVPGQTIKVELTAVRFDNNTFRCLGKMVS